MAKMNRLKEVGATMLALHLGNTELCHLYLSYNPIENGFCSLAHFLRFTKLSHLSLISCKINDEGVKVLAINLKKTHLITLDLSNNEITSCGAKILAESLRDSRLLHLTLFNNKIENDGIEALAQGAEKTFMTTLGISGEFSSYLLPVIWKNKVSVQHLVNTFKCIAPEVGDNSFCFTQMTSNSTTATFIENCLELYKNIIQKPSAVGVLLEDENISFSKDQIISLISNEFPRQFSQFIASGVDADVCDYVDLLKKAENWGLNKVVELLLLNRPLFTIDKKKEILDPYVYILLNKYNYTICNLDVEPEARQKIINYFSEHSDMEDASDVIRLLRGKRKL